MLVPYFGKVIFINAHTIDSRLGSCNDPSISNLSECVGELMRRVSVTKIKSNLGTNESHAAMRLW